MRLFRRRPAPRPVPYPQDADEQARAARCAHYQPDDLEEWRNDMREGALRAARAGWVGRPQWLPVSPTAVRDAARRRANLLRLADGLPPWHFDLARPVPAAGVVTGGRDSYGVPPGWKSKLPRSPL